MVSVGVLWDDEVEWDRETPFDHPSDEAYAYFSELADRKDVELFFAKYSWYSEGVLEKAWIFDSEWKKLENVELDVVHDKFRTDEETLRLKREIADELEIINRPELELLCKDKLETYQRFSEYLPETRKASRENIKQMRDQYGKIVLKPRRAYGAEGIYILEEEDSVPDVDKEYYIVQRFVDSSGGIPGLVDGSHDLRGIVVNGKLLGAYIRYNEDSEISNVSEGGEKVALDVEEFPKEARNIVEKVTGQLEFDPAIFSVDFFYDQNSNPWVVELNGKPGLTFYGDEEIKRRMKPIMEELIDSYRGLVRD